MKEYRALNLKISPKTHGLLKLYATAKDIKLSQAVDELLIGVLKNMSIHTAQGITVTHIDMVDEETEQRIGKSMEDIQKGRVTRLSTQQQIQDHFESL